MRLAAIFAGVILNAALLDRVFETQYFVVNPVSIVVGPLVWGLFLVFGVWFVPARLGMGLPELAVAVLGEWVGGVVWRAVAPVWLLLWFLWLSPYFVVGAEAGLLGENLMWSELPWQLVMVYGLWLGVTANAALARWIGVLGAAVLVAAPLAYWREWPGAGAHVPQAICCAGTWAMQDTVLYVAPPLLFAGSLRGRVWEGLTGVLGPLLLATVLPFVTYAGAHAAKGTLGHSYVTAASGIHLGTVPGWKMLLLGMTVVGAGGFCISRLGEYLGVWRRWTVPLAAIILMAGRKSIGVADAYLWLGTALLALAGVICGGYLARREFVFERGVGVAAWLAGCWFWEEPVVAWAVGFAGMGLGVKLCDWRRSMRG